MTDPQLPPDLVPEPFPILASCQAPGSAHSSSATWTDCLPLCISLGVNDRAPRRLKIAGGASCKTCHVAGVSVGSCSPGCKRGSPPGAGVGPVRPEDDAVTEGPAAPGSRLRSRVRGRRRRAHAGGGQRLDSCHQSPSPASRPRNELEHRLFDSRARIGWVLLFLCFNDSCQPLGMSCAINFLLPFKAAGANFFSCIILWGMVVYDVTSAN